MGIVEQVVYAVGINSDGPVEWRRVNAVCALLTVRTREVTGDNVSDEVLEFLWADFRYHAVRGRGMGFGVFVLMFMLMWRSERECGW